MIEYDDELLNMQVPLYRVEIINEEAYLRGAHGKRRRDESRTMRLIRKVLAADDDQWVGRFCVGESVYCDAQGGNTTGADGFFTHRKDVLLFDDANTAFAVRMTFS